LHYQRILICLRHTKNRLNRMTSFVEYLILRVRRNTFKLSRAPSLQPVSIFKLNFPFTIRACVPDTYNPQLYIRLKSYQLSLRWPKYNKHVIIFYNIVKIYRKLNIKCILRIFINDYNIISYTSCFSYLIIIIFIRTKNDAFLQYPRGV